MTVIGISVTATRNIRRLCFSIFFLRDRGYVFISMSSLCSHIFFHLRKKTCRPCCRMSWTRSKLLCSSCTIYYNLNGFGNFYRPIYYDITCEWLYFINYIHKYLRPGCSNHCFFDIITAGKFPTRLVMISLKPRRNVKRF